LNSRRLPGCIQVYTGEGKGKTTAALGLALRAAGAGLPVFLGQFLKGRRCSEHRALDRFDDLITVRLFGREEFVTGEPSAADIEAARSGLAEARDALTSGSYDVVILDEATEAVELGLFSVDDLLAAVDARAERVEVVVTGRHAPPKLLERADLVTEMRAVKHYFDRGVKARKGIEE
jgi:cob(I)alamin adenosyltransferase